MVGEMEKANLSTMILVIMKEKQKKPKEQGMALLFGRMGGNTQEIGQIIECMEKGLTLGKMDVVIQENIILIRSKGMVFFLGQMVSNIKVIGQVESSMGKGYFLKMGLKEKADGTKANEFNGLNQRKRVI